MTGDQIKAKYRKFMDNFDRQCINNRKESASRYYRMFKTSKNSLVKRRAGLEYLKLTSEIRKLQEELSKRS